MLVDHLDVVIAAAGQVLSQLPVGQLLGVERLESAVRPDRLGLERLIPLPELVAPELLVEHLLRPRKALRRLVGRDRPRRVVGEAVDVPVRNRVQEHSVVARELGEATLERFRVHFGPVARGRTREMDALELPRTGARRLELKLGA